MRLPERLHNWIPQNLLKEYFYKKPLTALWILMELRIAGPAGEISFPSTP
jgi:hypothetical protein